MQQNSDRVVLSKGDILNTLDSNYCGPVNYLVWPKDPQRLTVKQITLNYWLNSLRIS